MTNTAIYQFNEPNSSAIKKVEWTNGVLKIWFPTSGPYRYPKVPMPVFIAFHYAESKGKFFHQRIRNQYGSK